MPIIGSEHLPIATTAYRYPLQLSDERATYFDNKAEEAVGDLFIRQSDLRSSPFPLLGVAI